MAYLSGFFDSMNAFLEYLSLLVFVLDVLDKKGGLNDVGTFEQVKSRTIGRHYVLQTAIHQ